MKSKLFVGAGLLLCGAIAFAAKEKVVMTVNGVDVPKSEFEYLYHKNAQQQTETQPLDEYVEMFKIYKLKVADALANGIDTTADFKREMQKYRRELAEPYMTDSTFIAKLAREQYNRMQYEYQPIHIMFPKTRSRAANIASKAKADSVLQLLRNGADFAQMAKEFSFDKASSENGGNMGYMVPGRLPYDFETVMINTPEGQISEVIESPVGYHIIMGSKRRPHSGKFKAQHILVLTDKKAGPQADDIARQKADSIYALLQANPERFDELARQLSDDKASAVNAGMLPEFEAGQMIPEFFNGVVALKDGEIGAPIKSNYGYHIIKRIQKSPRDSYETVRPMLYQRITYAQDDRSKQIRDYDFARFGKKFKLKYNQPAIDEIHQYVLANGLTTDINKQFTGDGGKNTLFWLDNEAYPVSGMFDVLKSIGTNTDVDSIAALDNYIKLYTLSTLKDAERMDLINRYPDYRNLLNEYRDGSLLYEISLQKVWDKAAKDDEGLKQFFSTHKKDFAWQQKHIKGFLVKCTTDSVATAVRERLAQLPADEIVPTIRKEFAKNVQIDKVLVKQGDNKFVDYLMFNPNSEPPVMANYPVYFMYDAKELIEPEEVDDVKGLVIGAYQDQLEQEWVEWLKGQYPVTLNEKELKKIK